MERRSQDLSDVNFGKRSTVIERKDEEDEDLVMDALALKNIKTSVHANMHLDF